MEHQNTILTEPLRVSITREEAQFQVMGKTKNWHRKAGYIKGTYSSLQRIKLLVL